MTEMYGPEQVIYVFCAGNSLAHLFRFAMLKFPSIAKTV